MNSQSVALPAAEFASSKKFWIGLAIVCWLGFVIAHIPAVWGAYFMTRSGALGLTGVSGTLWSGRASLASVKVKDADYSLGQLTWAIDVFSLLVLNPCANVKTEMDNQQFKGKVCAGLNGAVTISNADANFPAELIQSQLPLAIDGQFSAHFDKLSFQKQQLSGLQGKLSWMGAKVFNGTNWMMLGGYKADLVDDGKAGLTARLTDVSSPVKADTTITLLAAGGGSVVGSLEVNELFNREAKVSTWLSMFAGEGVPDAQGNLKYNININL